jgi:hypothetical protein
VSSSNTKIDDNKVLELKSEGWNNRQISRVLSCDEASVRRSLERSKYEDHLLPVEQTPERFEFNLDQPIVLRDADAIITADWHIPIFDPNRVNQLVLEARAHAIKTLVIAGDYFNFDALSAYDPKQSEAGLERELDEGISVMRVLNATFDRIIYIWGNHDARLHRALGYKTRFDYAMKQVFGSLGLDLLSKMEFSSLDHLWMVYGEPDFEAEGDDGEPLQLWERYRPQNRWYICHPQSYSRIPLSTARQLCAKQGANVITAHSHHCAIGFGPSGDLIAAEAGGLFDRKKTAYLSRSTTFPNWQPGYGYMLGGRFHLRNPLWGTA